MSEIETMEPGPSRNPTRLYIVVAALLVVVIIVAGYLLATKGIPALRGQGQPTAGTQLEPTATPVPTFTPAPTRLPTDTPLLPPTPTLPALVMGDTDTPTFEFDSAGARPGADWTGFFGQVLDATGQPLAGIPIIVWYRDGTPASDVVRTDSNGAYELRLADAPLAGNWSIQVLTDDGKPASKLFSFATDLDTQAGVQQIQVIWRQIP